MTKNLFFEQNVAYFGSYLAEIIIFKLFNTLTC